MMCRHELGSLQGPGPVITSTENRTAKPAEDGPRAKFLCSFGGSILPRPSDGKLRYAGGETRMVSVGREITYRELMAKMTELYDQALTVKYQQPDEDLDALVSVVCDEDVANMMEEYDKLQARDGFSRLRLFLFSAAEHRDLPSVDAIERPRQQRYVDALNGLPESSKNPEIPVIGVGVAHEVAAALPVPSVQPLLPVASSTTATTTSSSSSSPSSPCCSGQVPVDDQYYPRKSESYVASDAEIPSEGQFDINAGMHHSGFVFDREYKQSTEAFMANAEASGNLPQIWPQFDWQHTGVPSGIEISKDRGIPDDLSIQFNMQHRPPPRQQQMLLAYQQAAGHSAGGVYRHHELVYKNYHDDLVPPSSPQNKPFLHPLVRQEEEKRHPKNDNGIERSWSAQYYATASQISHNFSSLLRSGSEADYHGTSAALACEVDFGNAYQQNVQMHWVCDEYGNRADYGSDEVSGNFLPFSSCLACNSHMCSDEHVMWQHQQPVFLGEDTSFQVQNLNHLQSMFDENSLTELHYASGQAGEDLSEVWSSNSYRQHLPPHLDQPGSNKAHFQTLKQGGEYHPDVSKDQMSAQNATTMVDQRMYPVEQAETRTNFQERLDKARGWVLNQANHQTEEVRMPMAGKADGVCVADRSTHRDFGPNNYWGCYSGSHCCVNPANSYHIPPVGDFYKPVISNYDKPQAHAPVIVESGTMHGNITAMYSRDSFLRGLKTPEMENCSQGKVQSVITGTHLDHTSGVHLQPNNGQSFRLLGVVEERAPEAVSGRNDGPKIERMGHPHVLYRNNVTADAPNIPCYMPDDLLSKNMNNSNNDDHHFMGPHLVREIEDINSLTVVSIKGQAGFEHGALTTWESNVFVASGSNKVLPDHSFSCVVTSTNLVHDRSTLSSHEALPSITSSSPPRSDILSSISPPVYDQSPANSTKATVPENFWSECEGGREVKELKTKVVAENNSMGIVTRQLGVEVYSNDSGASRQNKDLDKGMPDASLNDKVNADICHTSRPVESAVHHPSLSSSPVTLGSNEVDKQTSPGSAKEVVNKEDKDEGTLPISDTEEELGKREVPENYPSGVDEDSNGGSVEIAKSLSSEAELEALARGLQTIRNADLEEIRELGSGTYGTVYHGKWKGSDVAIKRIKASCFAGRPSERERLIADFWKEASILSQLHHPNVVSFYGVVRDGPGGTLATVTEFMVNGSLKQVLHKKDRTIDRRKRLIIAMDAAFGMEYLHGKNIVHFDLKCENLLVNMRDPHRPVCKIGDMGLSKVKHQTLVSGGVRGTLPWMAPELLTCKSGMVTDKIDVYSFGIVMWELLTGDEPYANMHCGSIIGGIMNNTLRPPVPSWCDPAWRSLMERCWSSDPGQRPPFSDIAKELRALAASINLK